MLESMEWLNLAAVKNARVYVADGNLFFNRSSCGVVDTAEIVAEMAWPELKGLWGHHGKHWVALDELDAFCDREGARPASKRGTAGLIVAEQPAANSKQAKLEDATSSVARVSFSEPSEFVTCQVELLRSESFEEAFLMNSAANRARLGSALKFETVVKSNPSFAALADPVNAYKCFEDAYANGKHTIEVRVQAAMGDGLTFAFEVSETEGGVGFATEGVRIVC
uniref:Fe/B12 periplasmic-binding domain-containing protein n=1 Tax=Haptolina brevifila TaxID=156173 RepID=A0A7S2HWQ3_9EUKA|mmetsp:Transcript_58661/g.116471  ORF Transcript_58661/g.116471 Transcript_58661/m.116471 type:complete len:224 (+) Transcript_58661:95-766(+)